MSEKRYKVPEGMLEVGYDAWMIYGDYPAHDPARKKVVEQMLERIIEWQGKHPQKATEQFVKEMIDQCQGLPAAWGYHPALIGFAIIVAEEWQRRMFLAPESEVDRIDFFVRTTDGHFIPLHPSDAQRAILYQGLLNKEPKMPEGVKDLASTSKLETIIMPPEMYNANLLEAYRRGEMTGRGGVQNSDPGGSNEQG